MPFKIAAEIAFIAEARSARHLAYLVYTCGQKVLGIQNTQSIPIPHRRLAEHPLKAAAKARFAHIAKRGKLSYIHRAGKRTLYILLCYDKAAIIRVLHLP